jgi:hypothetical protein
MAEVVPRIQDWVGLVPDVGADLQVRPRLLGPQDSQSANLKVGPYVV